MLLHDMIVKKICERSRMEVVCAGIIINKCALLFLWFSVVCAGLGRGQRPIVFGDAGPEDPDHDNSQECKQRFKETSIDGSVGRSTEVYADDILEDLSDSEEEHCCDEVD